MMTDQEIMALVLEAFQEEQAEHRQAAGELLLELERNPDHPQRKNLIDRLFREAHSLKGGARSAGLPDIEQLAHQVEDVFSAVRQGRCQITPDVCDPIYASLDAIGAMMELVATSQPTDLAPYRTLQAKLGQILENTTHDAPPTLDTPAEPRQEDTSQPTRKPRAKRSPAPSAETASAPSAPPEPKDSNASAPAPSIATVQPPQAAEPGSPPAGIHENDSDTDAGDGLKDISIASVRLSTAVLDGLLNESGELITCAVGLQQQAHDAHQISEIPARWRRIWRQAQPLISRLQSRAPAIRPTVHYLNDRHEMLADDSAYSNERDTQVLLELLGQANTLIATLEQQLGQHARQLVEGQARLQIVSDRLRQQVRQTRMLSVNTLFSPLRLQLRDIARSADKQISFEIDDGGAEADRHVIERLGEVLLHLLRNAVDHGIEAPDIRRAHGKPEQGHIALRAEVRGDRLILSISDDGAGINLAAIQQQALASEQWSKADLARMSEADLIDLIFLPSFSTRTTVSKLSGRGVGLDIVRSRVERMHGTISVQSQAGAGCLFTISLPLSLANTHGLLLQAGTTTYAIPLESVQRIVSVSARDIRPLDGRTAILIDGQPFALVHMNDLLQQQSNIIAGNLDSTWHGLMIGSGERQIVCLVDRVFGEQELVIYRLPAPLQQVSCVVGATILADGQVIPILDAADLLRLALGSRRTIQLSTETQLAVRQPSVLVVDDSITTRTLEKNILEAAGYKVRLAVDGAEAFRLLQRMGDSGGFDLLLSDVDMPHMNGFELTKQIRSSGQLRHLPIVLVTSLESPEDRERGIAVGADAYIVKRQFEQQALLDTISRLI